jgi:hypothetical protein
MVLALELKLVALMLLALSTRFAVIFVLPLTYHLTV